MAASTALNLAATSGSDDAKFPSCLATSLFLTSLVDPVVASSSMPLTIFSASSIKRSSAFILAASGAAAAVGFFLASFANALA